MTPSLEGEIQAQLVRDLFERSRLAILTMLVLIGVIRWAMDPAYQAEGSVRGLFWVLILVNLGRLVLALVPLRRGGQPLSTRASFLLFTSGVVLSSITLAALVVLSWPLLDPARIAIVAVLTSGLVSGAVMSLGFSPMVYMIYMIPPVGALLLMALTDHRPPWGAGILATAFTIYGVAVIAISLDQRRTRRRAIELELKLSDLVVRDGLTQLHNRRFLQEFMTVEGARLARESRDLALGREPGRDAVMGVYMLDLDFFKHVNDTHGHAAGDAVLQQAAAILSATLRRSDNLVRWGGEEFVAVAWVKHPDHPRIVAEKIRHAVEQTPFLLPDGQTLKKTVSLGYCVLPFFPDQAHLVTWEQALAMADAALYVAKAEGRNRWVGVALGNQPWADTQQTLAEILLDLQRAHDRGLVILDRFQAPEPSRKS